VPLLTYGKSWVFVTAKEFGDINISTLYSLLMIAGLAFLTRL
jgi:hypothetical protein